MCVILTDEWFEDIGGALNFQHKKFLALVDSIIAGDVGMLVIAHKDRLARFGFPLIEHVFETHHCELIVMNNRSLCPEPEFTDGVLTTVHSFSSQLCGLGNYRKTLKEALAHGSDHNQSPQDTLEPHA